MTSTQAFRNALHVPTNDPAAGRTVTVVTPGDEYTAAWQIAGGVPEAPLDAQLYGRQSETWQPILPQAASVILDSIKTVDGIGSGLDADLLDGLDGAYYLNWANITNKPSTFTPSSHSHPQAEVTDLVTDLAGKAPIVHTHAQADVTGLTADLASKLPLAGGTMTGLLTLKASDATAPLNMPQGVTPSSPNNGDVWLNNTVMTIRANGTTYATAYLNGTSTFNGAKTFSVKPVMTTPSASTASVNLPLGVAPTTPVDGDMWATSAGLYVRISGVTVGPLAASGAADWSAITGKPATFPPDAHTHTVAQITDLPATLATYLPLAGGTLTGDLVINKPSPKLVLQRQASVESIYAYGRDEAGLDLWRFGLGQGGGSNNASFGRYDAAGVYINSPFIIDWATGLTTMANGASVTGGVTANYLRLTNVTDASLTSTLHAFQIGADSSANIIIDNNEIQARSNGAAATLTLNLDGGNVNFGAGLVSSAGGYFGFSNNVLRIESDSFQQFQFANAAAVVKAALCYSVSSNYFQIRTNVDTTYQPFTFDGSVFTSAGNIEVAVAYSSTGVVDGTTISKSITRTSKLATTTVSHRAQYNPNGLVGQITTNASATAYVTSSDETKKADVRAYEAQTAIDIIRADPVKAWVWKDVDSSPGVGWIAQHSQTVNEDLAVYVPPSVILDKDGKESEEPGWWGIDYGRRTPYLWAALSAALDKIDQLEARLAALEGA